MKQETVLLYYPKKPKYLPRLKALLLQLGVKIRMLDASSIEEKMGYLAALEGYEKSDCKHLSSGEKIPEPMMILCGFSSVRIDQLFSYMRRSSIPSIPLKAILTETNVDWTLFELYQEISEEHRRMHMEKESS